MPTPRLSLTMNDFKLHSKDAAPEVPSARAGRLVVWILLALGLLLMLVSASNAEQASRVDNITGTLSSGQTLRVENVSGDVVVSPGKSFAAVVTVTATAASKERANALLSGTRIEQSHDEDGFALETQLAGMRHGGDWHKSSSCRDCKVVASYAITVPPGVNLSLETVNGDVRVSNCDGELSLETVNGAIDARGVRRGVQGQSVNGPIEVVAT